MKTLEPNRLVPSYWRDVERQVAAAFEDLLYGPVIALVRRALPTASRATELENASGEGGPLKSALRAGRIQYDVKTGTFSGAVRGKAIADALFALGATFDKRSVTYRLPAADAPGWLLTEAAEYAMKVRRAHEDLLKHLDVLEARVDPAVDAMSVDVSGTVKSIADGWQAAAAGIELKPDFSPEGLAILRDNYEATLRLSIKKQTKDQIASLRALVADNVAEGYRAEALTEGIRDKYAMSKAHARFVAKQESSILMADVNEARCAELGLEEYIWDTSHDARVRPDHKRLDGKKFSYKNPPVVDQRTGRRDNPGRDYGCRCAARTVVGSLKSKELARA